MDNISTGQKDKLRFISHDEVVRRLLAITTEDSLRLSLIGDIYAAGTGMTGSDLRQEAFVAALERRRWREDLSLIQFITGVMKSLAHSSRKSEKIRPLDRALATGSTGQEEMDRVQGSEEGQPEDEAVSDEAERCLLENLEKVFQDDAEVLLVIERRLAGDSPSQVKVALGMNQTKYETVCRRLLRRFRKHIRSE